MLHELIGLPLQYFSVPVTNMFAYFPRSRAVVVFLLYFTVVEMNCKGSNISHVIATVQGNQHEVNVAIRLTTTLYLSIGEDYIVDFPQQYVYNNI